MTKFLLHNADRRAYHSIDLSELLSGHVCDILQEDKHSVLLKNDSPYKEDGDPEKIWVRKENGEFVNDDGSVIL